MNILILGGNGFIGTTLTTKLVANNHYVRVLDIIASNEPIKDVDYYIGNWADDTLINNALQNIDVVFHLITTSIPGTSNLDPLNDVQNNLINTIKFLECMIKNDVKKIVYFSSGGAIYDKSSNMPVDENKKLGPISSYGVVKSAIELYLSMYTELYNLDVVILRPSNIYGLRKSLLGVHGIVSTTINNVSNNLPITIWGDGNIVRDFIYIDDLIIFCELLLQKYIAGTYNIGGGKGYKINEVIQLVFDITKKQAPIIYKEGRACDVQKIILDTAKIQSTFNWKPTISLKAGIKNIWDMYQSQSIN